jgi:hypothetical protein
MWRTFFIPKILASHTILGPQQPQEEVLRPAIIVEVLPPEQFVKKEAQFEA